MSYPMITNDSCITPPVVAALDVAYAKLHLRSIVDDDDVLIQSWIEAATQYFEEITGRQIMAATWEYWLDAFPVENKIEIPHPPLIEVTAVEYVSSDGTVSDFTSGSPLTPLWQTRAPAGTYARRGWIEPLYGQSWPSARTESGAVRIRYRAGYATTAGAVPDAIKAALLLLVGQFDRFRSELHISQGARLERLPMGVDQMLSGFKYTALSSQVLTRSW